MLLIYTPNSIVSVASHAALRSVRLRRRIFELSEHNQKAFEEMALILFHYQATHNLTYQRYISALGRRRQAINRLEEIPFLPIQLYRTHLIQTSTWEPELYFESSGTSSGATSDHPSRHPIQDLSFYEEVAQRTFEHQYGSLRGMLILALLPDYLSRPQSSLIYMLRAFMKESGHSDSGFFLDDFEALAERICATSDQRCEKQLWVLPSALRRFVDQYPNLPLDSFRIIETGGIKRSSTAMSLEEQRAQLQKALNGHQTESEYGMTELLSQAYARDGRHFRPPPWMSVIVRTIDDPLQLAPEGDVGGLNIIDLACVHSCAFIATEDLGRSYSDRSFEVLGRCSDTPPRGCAFLDS